MSVQLKRTARPTPFMWTRTLALAVSACALVSAEQTPELVPQGRGTAFSYHVALGGDTKWLAQADRDRVRVFDMATGRIARELRLPNGATDPWGLLAFAAHPHADLIVMCEKDGAIVAFDVASGTELWRTPPFLVGPDRKSGSFYRSFYPNLHFTSDGAMVNVMFVVTTFRVGMSAMLRGGSGTTVYGHQVSARTGRAAVVDKPEVIGNVPAVSAFSDDGKWMHLTRGNYERVRGRLRDVRTRREVGRELSGLIVASSALSRRVLLRRDAGNFFNLVLSDPDTGRDIRVWRGLFGAFSQDGSKLLVSGGPAFASWLLVDALTGSLLLAAPPETPMAMIWALSPDAGRVASAQGDKLVVVEVGANVEYRVVGPDPSAVVTWAEMEDASRSGNPDERLVRIGTSWSAKPSAYFTRDGRWLAAHALDGKIDVWDVATGNRMPFRLDAGPYKAGLPNGELQGPVGDGSDSIADLTTNGPTVLVAENDGAIAIRPSANAEAIGHLRVMGGGEWLVTTSAGLFDGSPGGWRALAWRIDGRFEPAAGELFFNEFYQPGLLADLLAGRPVRTVRTVAERDRRQPTVTLTTAAVDGRTALVRLSVAEAAASDRYTRGSGARDLRLFRNGVLVKAWRGDLPLDAAGTMHVEARVPLVAGNNRLVAYAFNADNIKSADAEVTVSHDAAARQETVYVLAIGVNRYTNSEFDLTYAAPDATAFSAEFARSQRGLGATRVRAVNLLDGEATRGNILFALARLAGTQTGPVPDDMPPVLAALEPAQPEDTVVVYFAGHGVADAERFHLIPSDLPYSGPRSSARSALDQLLARSISDVDLERAFEPIDARHLLLVIDACQSGQALESEDARFGPMNSRGLAQLAYEKGMSILTASQGYQAAIESAQLGHGYLTFALVDEGLKSAVADQKPPDGAVTVEEWFDYAVSRVPQLQLGAIQRAAEQGRVLTFDEGVSSGRDGRLQTPRVFSRRDPAVPPLVIARP